MVEVGGVRPIAGGAAAPVAVGGRRPARLRLYMRATMSLVLYSRSRERAEAAAKALRALGVAAEAKRGAGGFWRVAASLGRLAAGAPELREAVAEAVKEAHAAGLVPEERAGRWLERLRSGRVARRPGYGLTLAKSGAVMVRYMTTSPANLEREAQRLRDMGLVEGLHFTVKAPGGGKAGYIYVRREGLRRAAAAARGNPAAAEFVEHILRRAEEAGGEVWRRVKEVVEAGRAVGSLRLSEVRGAVVEVGGRRHAVTVLSWDVQWDSRRLRISILAEVDGVEGWHAATFYRIRRRVAGSAYAEADAPGGAEAEAERLAAVIKAVAGKEPRRYLVRGRIIFYLGRAHLDGFGRYAELAEVVEGWLAASWLV